MFSTLQTNLFFTFQVLPCDLSCNWFSLESVSRMFHHIEDVLCKVTNDRLVSEVIRKNRYNSYLQPSSSCYSWWLNPVWAQVLGRDIVCLSGTEIITIILKKASIFLFIRPSFIGVQSQNLGVVSNSSWLHELISLAYYLLCGALSKFSAVSLTVILWKFFWANPSRWLPAYWYLSVTCIPHLT